MNRKVTDRKMERRVSKAKKHLLCNKRRRRSNDKLEGKLDDIERSLKIESNQTESRRIEIEPNK